MSVDVAQCIVFIRFDAATQPSVLQAHVEFLISDIHGVPVVAFYIDEYERATDLDEYERWMYALSDCTISLAVGAYLPIKAMDGDRESLGVYRIDHKCSEGAVAQCHLYLADDTVARVRPGTLLARSAANRAGVVPTCDSGRVIEVFSI